MVAPAVEGTSPTAPGPSKLSTFPHFNIHLFEGNHIARAAVINHSMNATLRYYQIIVLALCCTLERVYTCPSCNGANAAYSTERVNANATLKRRPCFRCLKIQNHRELKNTRAPKSRRFKCRSKSHIKPIRLEQAAAVLNALLMQMQSSQNVALILKRPQFLALVNVKQTLESTIVEDNVLTSCELLKIIQHISLNISDNHASSVALRRHYSLKS